MITFTPLCEPFGCGADDGQGSSRGEQPKALAYLAEVDDIRILVDCGSAESFHFDGPGKLDDVLRE